MPRRPHITLASDQQDPTIENILAAINDTCIKADLSIQPLLNSLRTVIFSYLQTHIHSLQQDISKLQEEYAILSRENNRLRQLVVAHETIQTPSPPPHNEQRIRAWEPVTNVLPPQRQGPGHSGLFQSHTAEDEQLRRGFSHHNAPPPNPYATLPPSRCT